MINTTIAEITTLSHEGRGIAKIAGKTVFIDGALPGETVKFEYSKRKRRFDEGKLIEVITASPDRAIPPCAHFSICGGCSLQHLNTEAQLSFKQAIVLEQLRHFGGVEPKTILPPLLGPKTGYRRRARLGVKYVAKKEKVLLGFREKRSNLLADLDGCEVLEPVIGKLFVELKKLITHLQAYQEIPQIEVAIGDTITALVFRHMQALSESDQKSLIEFGMAHKIDIYLQPKGPETIHRIWPDPKMVRPLSYKHPEFDIAVHFEPSDFTQVNAMMNQQMVSKVIEYLDLEAQDRVLDLFCGLGNFTLPIAKHAAFVVGVEGSVQSVNKAKENAVLNNLSNVEFYAANLEMDLQGSEKSEKSESGLLNQHQHQLQQQHQHQYQRQHQHQPWLKETYSKLLLDPPRTGARAILPYIANLGLKRIVYVSCNPATLARDVGDLVKNQGYTLESLTLLDMFPHTTHVESIVVLQK